MELDHAIAELADLRTQLAASEQERDKIRATLATMMNQADAEEGRTEGSLAAYREMLHETEAKLAAQIEHTKKFDPLIVAVSNFLNVDIEDDDCPFPLLCDYDPDSVTPAEGHSEGCPIRKLSDAYQAIPESYLAEVKAK